MGFWDKVFGDPNEKIVKAIQPIVDKINSFEPSFKERSDEDLKNFTIEARERLSSLNKDNFEECQKALDALLPEAFAAVREASFRVLGQRHYDVQLIGGIVLHRGQISEMKTGEGKTLVATLPLYLNALLGKGAHLITVNDYLSRVGAGWMAPVYYSLGLTTGVIVHDNAYIYDPEANDEGEFDPKLKPFRKVSRKEAYSCDITYGTNNEFGFDYLKDNMVTSLDRMVQRDFYYCIVDEIDSILIDEARTPLIISAPAEESNDRYFRFAELVKRLNEGDDYNVDEKMRAATLTEGGISRMEKFLGVENIYVAGGVKDVHNIEQALKAQVLFKRDKDYVVKDGEIIIVDEFTGRMMPGRRYSEGLHQAIEAKEGVIVQRESQTLATVTFQNYFRMYPKLSGMTGTAVTEAEEFYKIYKLETIVIPTNKPNVRQDYNDLIYRTKDGKFKAVIEEVKERSAKGQPVLIGTVSIEDNELLGLMMEREGLRPNILNAKNHFREAEIISQAGKPGSITIATNMAGRGVDIILGGNPPEGEDQKKVKELGGLHVIGTERHESRRIDNQLRGRAGRQGDPGSSQFYISADDDLMRIFGGDRLKGVMNTLRMPEDMPIQNKMVSNSIESAQKRVEGNNFDLRKHVVEYDDVINKHREAIYKRRREVLDIYEKTKEENEKTLSSIISEMIEDEISQVVIFHTAYDDYSDWNFKEIYEVTNSIFTLTTEQRDKVLSYKDSKKIKEDVRAELTEYLINLSRENYQKMAEGFDNIEINFVDIEKGILLRSIDNLWIEHLETVDYLRKGIGLRGYGQRDPLVEYKKEAYRMYHELIGLIQRQVVYSIYKTGDVSNFMAPSIMERATRFSAPAKEMARRMVNDTGTVDLVKDKAKDEEGNKVGRNDLCPCGSGKKYKKCCGA
ncbi:MAG: preprotein translocase subunit SecA [Candidatus Dojkabacteria bacterium]